MRALPLPPQEAAGNAAGRGMPPTSEAPPGGVSFTRMREASPLRAIPLPPRDVFMASPRGAGLSHARALSPLRAIPLPPRDVATTSQPGAGVKGHFLWYL